MRKLTILLLIIPLISFGQSWTYEEGGNVFDGQFKTSSVKGKGANYPYTSPSLVINIFEGEQLDFYISGGGYFQEKTGIGVLWVFDNEPDKIYSTYDWSISPNGEILFFREFNNPDGSGKLKPIDVIDKLTLGSKVTVRIKDDFSSNDIVFSLNGSSKAINFVIPKEKRQQMIVEAKDERIKKEKEEKIELIDEIDDDEIYNFVNVESRPIFPGCENLSTEEERANCFTLEIQRFVLRNFEFPEEAIQMGIQGKVWVEFVVDKSGSVNGVAIVRGVDKLLDDEALRVVKKLPRMKPAKVGGRSVSMRYSLPINARLK